MITIDTHDDRNVKNFTDSIDYIQTLGIPVNLPKIKEGGLDVSWLILYPGQEALKDAVYE